MKDVSQDVHVLIQQVDMLKTEQIEQMVVITVSNWGRLDYAVNAAGEKFVSSLCHNRQACMIMGGFPKICLFLSFNVLLSCLVFLPPCFPCISDVSNVPVL